VTAFRAALVRRRFLFLEVGATALIIVIIWLALGPRQSYAAVPLTEMIRTFFQVWCSSLFVTDVLPSLERLASGYLIAVVVGVVLGFLLGLSRILRYTFQPVVAFLRAIPPVALLPLALVMLGVGDSMKIAVIAFVCLWPIVLNVVDGLAELDATLLDTVRAYHIGWYDRLVRVLLPAISPRALAGMRTSLSLAVLMVVSSEIEASSNGIGFFLYTAQESFAIADMWAAIILLGLLGYVLNMAFTVFERWVLRWQIVSGTEV
jgi:ABC-type nitrate/sulfonate/bicarbonate transport system permease component